VSFWNWRSSGPMVGGTAALAGTDLAAVELYTADTRLVGWVATGGRRVTDLLEDSDELRIWRPNPGKPDDLDGTPGQASAPHPGHGGEWQMVVTDRVVLIMPPEWRVNRQLRFHRKLRRVALMAGPFAVTGNAHLPLEAEPDWLIHNPRHFLPLTDAHLLHSGEPAFEHVISVVIVNTAHATSLVPLVTLA